MVPVSVEEMKPLTFGCAPAVVAVTLTDTVPLPPAATLPAVGEPKVRVVLPATGAQVGVEEKLQVVAAAGVAATCRPAGSVSVKVKPVSAKLAFGLVIVKVSVDVPLTATGLGENDLDIVTG